MKDTKARSRGRITAGHRWDFWRAAPLVSSLSLVWNPILDDRTRPRVDWSRLRRDERGGGDGDVCVA